LGWEHQVGLMSGGQQRKVAILLALAARSEVLILDEPAAGLDPVARRQLIDELLDIITRGDGCTVLFSTHIFSDLERVAEHVGIMDRGHLISSGRLEDLQTKTKRIQVIFDAEEAPEGFTIPGAVRSRTEGPVVHAVVRLESESQLEGIRRMSGVRVNTFPLGLEESFIELFDWDPHEEEEVDLLPQNLATASTGSSSGWILGIVIVIAVVLLLLLISGFGVFLVG